MVASGLVDRLQPADLIRDWLERPRAELRTLEAETPLLLVRLDSVGDEMAKVLAAASTVRGERLAVAHDSIGFRTVAAEGAAPLVAAQAARREALAQRLAHDHHFVVPLKKRKGADRPFADRIFVGRAHSTDVVLRHRSVSKSHAWFEANAEGWRICDAGSKNGTTRNGEALEARQPSPIAPGDEIVFGKIETVFAMPEALWDLLGI
jgi:hypothetical protein